jgi:acyl transferase domain-containing protein
MRTKSVAIMFAGQGRLDFREPDATDRRGVNAARTGLLPWAARSAARLDAGPPGLLDQSIYMAALAAFGRVRDAGLTPHSLIGHGFGEIAALVAAGAFSVPEGAEIVEARRRALADGATGRCGMAVVAGAPRQIGTLLNLSQADGVSLAAENSSRESVIAGPHSGLSAVADLARCLDLRFVRLKTSRATHHPSASNAGAIMKSKLRHLAGRRLQIPVFSSLKGRRYQDRDDLIDCLAEQLVKPIKFADAISRLVADGVTLIVECAPLRGLGAILDCPVIADTRFCRKRFATRAFAPHITRRSVPVQEVA